MISEVNDFIKRLDEMLPYPISVVSNTPKRNDDVRHLLAIINQKPIQKIRESRRDRRKNNGKAKRM